MCEYLRNEMEQLITRPDINPLDQVILKEEYEIESEFLKIPSDVKKEIKRKYVALNFRLQGYTFSRIAKALGVSRGRADQMVWEAVEIIHFKYIYMIQHNRIANKV